MIRPVGIRVLFSLLILPLVGTVLIVDRQDDFGGVSIFLGLLAGMILLVSPITAIVTFRKGNRELGILGALALPTVALVWVGGLRQRETQRDSRASESALEFLQPPSCRSRAWRCRASSSPSDLHIPTRNGLPTGTTRARGTRSGAGGPRPRPCPASGLAERCRRCGYGGSSKFYCADLPAACPLGC